MNDEDKWIQIAIRISRTQLEQIDALLPWVHAKAFGAEANRSTIVREVISRGLQSLQMQKLTENQAGIFQEDALERMEILAMAEEINMVQGAAPREKLDTGREGGLE
jgi:hypothetical protein